ncbi:MAG: septum site-determining protein MinC [Gammaproteobacteria bacterium]|jgi:septum site-determining protein MinC
MNSTAHKTQPLVFKGNAYTLTTLQLLSLDFEHIQSVLLDKIAQAPKFFEHIPLVLDLQKITSEQESLNLMDIVTCLREHKLLPIGVRGANTKIQEQAKANGLACLSDTKVIEAAQNKESKKQEKAQITTPPPSATRIITQPVRSGQQIYAQGGDLIVLSTVSHGAEILADGNIHVYGPLRGRALAGVMGDANTYIFCQSLEAELVSVAGQYRISEQLKETSSWEKAAQVSLVDNHLRIVEL